MVVTPTKQMAVPGLVAESLSGKRGLLELFSGKELTGGLGEARGASRLRANASDWQRQLLCDPQTSGGPLVAYLADRHEDLLRIIVCAYPAPRIISQVKGGGAFPLAGVAQW